MNYEEKIIITKYDLLYEQRMSRVESAVENINESLKELKADFRWMLGLMVLFSGSLATIMAKGFGWL